MSDQDIGDRLADLVGVDDKFITRYELMEKAVERIEALEAELAESCRDMRDEFLGQCPIAGELQARLDAIAALEIVEVMEILEQGDGNT